MRRPLAGERIVLLLLAASLATAFPHDWTVTEVSETWIGSSSVQQELIEMKSYGDAVTRLYMAAACGARQWCITACNTGHGSVLLLALISAARNKDPNGPPLMQCLTHGRRNNIVTAQAGITVHDFTPEPTSFTKRVAENLLDGVYDFEMNSCCLTNRSDSPYVVFDFGSVREFISVSLMAQSNEHYAPHFHDLDVRVGMSGASGDFSSYTRLGYYEGPAPYPNFEYHAEVEVPIEGRFLSIQIIAGGGKLQMCHLEVE